MSNGKDPESTNNSGEKPIEDIPDEEASEPFELSKYDLEDELIELQDRVALVEEFLNTFGPRIGPSLLAMPNGPLFDIDLWDRLRLRQLRKEFWFKEGKLDGPCRGTKAQIRLPAHGHFMLELSVIQVCSYVEVILPGGSRVGRISSGNAMTLPIYVDLNTFRRDPILQIVCRGRRGTVERCQADYRVFALSSVIQGGRLGPVKGGRVENRSGWITVSGTCGTARAEIPLGHTTEMLWNLTVMTEESCGAGVSVQYGRGTGDQVSVPAGSATIVAFDKQSPRPQTVVIDCPRGTGDCRFSYQLTHASATNDASVFVQDCANGGATVTLARPGSFFFRIFVDKACGGSADVTIPGQGGPVKAPQLKPTDPDSKASLEIGVGSAGARKANGKHKQIVIDCGTGSDECVYTYEFFETGRRRRRRRRP